MHYVDFGNFNNHQFDRRCLIVFISNILYFNYMFIKPILNFLMYI